MFSVEELVIQHRSQKVTVVNVKKRVTPTGRTDGMGILFMGYESVFCKKPPPWMRKDTDPDGDLDEEESGPTASSRRDLVSTGSNMNWSDEMQTILDTGAIKLIRTTNASTQNQLKEQLSVPMWVFTNAGPNVYYPQIEDSRNDDIEDDSPTDGAESRAPVAINKASATQQQSLDLNSCRQFSIVRYEDLSDPKKSMLMIQTPEQESIHNLQTGVKIQAIEDGSGDAPLDYQHSPNGDEQISSVSPVGETAVRTLTATSVNVTPTRSELCHSSDLSSHTCNTQGREVAAFQPQAVVRAKVPDANRVKLHFDSSPESPEDPVLTSPTISKYLQRDNPHMLMNSLRERTETPSEFWEAESGGEFTAKCRPIAHALAQGDSGVGVASVKETKLKARLADSALYRPSTGVPEAGAQLSLSHDVDSGIWDMIQGKDGEQSSQASSRGSTPVIHLRADDTKQVAPIVSDIQELHINDMLPSHPLEAQGDKPSIAYRAFKVDSDTNEVVLSKAKLATYVPLLDEPKLMISEEETAAIMNAEDMGENGIPPGDDWDDIIENESDTLEEVNEETGPRISLILEADEDIEKGPRISVMSESENEGSEYQMAIDAKLPMVSESETDVFESAVENLESSDAALTDATPINEEWEFVSSEQQSNALDVPVNETNDKTPTAENGIAIEKGQIRPSEGDTTQRTVQFHEDSVTENGSAHEHETHMVSECTQTSPIRSASQSRDISKPVRKTSVSRQRSYAQAMVTGDVTSPESEGGWVTAQETMESPAHRKVNLKPRRKKSDGTRPKVSARARDSDKCDFNSSDFAESTSDGIPSSTDTSESPNTPTAPVITPMAQVVTPTAQVVTLEPSKHTVVNREPSKTNEINTANTKPVVTAEYLKKGAMNAGSLKIYTKSADQDIPSEVPVKGIIVEYDYPVKKSSGTLVSDVANAMNLNSKNSAQSKPVRTRSGDGFDHSLYPWMKGNSADKQIKSQNHTQSNTPTQSTPKITRKSQHGLLKSAGGKPARNGDVRMKSAQSDDVDDAEREERELLACGSEDYRHSAVAPNPFEPPVSPLMARRDGAGAVTRAGAASFDPNQGKAKVVTKRGIMTRTSPPRDQAAVGLGLNQLQKAKVVTRTPVRPITMTSRQGIGLNQLKSDTGGKKKPALELSLLSPRGSSVSSEDTSPAHSRSSRGSESPYFVASYNDGSEDWGDESLLWDADDDDADDVSADATEDISALCDVEVFPDWMSELPDRLHDVPLASLAIPGSHISLAIERDMKTDMDIAKSNYEMAGFLRKLPNLSIFNNFRSLIKQIWKAWMPKQMLNVTQQLHAGVRYLDIRVSKYRSALYAEHGLYSKPLIKYLKQIKCYLDAHPKEVVIVQFEALNQIETKDKRRLVTSLFQIFGARMAKVANDMNKVTLTALWRRKKQIIIVFPHADIELLHNHIFVGLIWPESVLSTQSPKAQTQEELRNFLDSTYYNTQAMRMKKEAFQVTRAVLSPDMSMLFGEFEYESMRQLTLEETHKCVAKWLEHKTNINIVAFDFVGASKLIEQIIRLNDSKFAIKHTTV